MAYSRTNGSRPSIRQDRRCRLSVIQYRVWSVMTLLTSSVCGSSSRIKSTDSFKAFSFQCEKFAEAVVEEAKAKPSNVSRPRPRSNRPNTRDVNNNRPRVLPNPIAARRIQTLFKLSKKRAARQILNDNNTVYSGTNDQGKDYFTNTFSANPINIDEVL